MRASCLWRGPKSHDTVLRTEEKVPGEVEAETGVTYLEVKDLTGSNPQ